MVFHSLSLDDKIITSLAMKILEIHKQKSEDATIYLEKARKLKDEFGSGFSVVYCWFYSVPQRWITLEPKIFALADKTNNFDLSFILQIPPTKLAELMKTLIFHNKISLQFKNFCEAVRNEYFSWDHFVKEIKRKSIFSIFEILNEYDNIRITFKNLAAMKIFIGKDDDLLILDTHVADFLGINKNNLYKYRKKEKYFKSLLNLAWIITDRLRKYGLTSVTTVRWSLSIWFYKTKTSGELLLNYQSSQPR